MRGEGVRETLTGVAKLVLKHLAEKYGGGVEEAPQIAPLIAPPAPVEAEVESRPLEVEEISGGELLEEIEELPITEASGVPAAVEPVISQGRHTSIVEVPVVLDRSLFSGGGPVEIKLKLYIK